MSKTAQAILVGFATALVVGFGLGFITSLGGETLYGQSVGAGFFAGIGAAFIFANLSGNRKIASASQADKAAALAATPAEGKALVYVYRDAYVGKLVGMNIEIDGQAVAQIKSPRFTLVTVKGGRHVLSAGFAGFAGTQARPETEAFDFPPGTASVLKVANRVGLLRGGLKFEPQADLAAARQRLARMPMTPADIAEL